ncbi:DUF5667 domain-containing protein [Alkalibacter mobilis]|uniref:DUF5667 domain-containing protein n=1 Tax=Alkalibacter mobilis TaxID=2787712 RepID=UPI0018A10F9E|nr:DUF5667 domain-containing protein [Alkalibacter mobilis]MBF7096443.1 hypothetical protein [Alkalibacter mobilis]
MKKKIKVLFLAILISCLIVDPAFASDLTIEKDIEAGITPDSIFYTFDQLVEDLQVALSSSPENDAQLLLQFAQERLSEAKVMELEEKDEYIEEALEDYLEKFEEAQELIAESLVSLPQDDVKIEELYTELEEAAVVENEEISDDLEEDLDNAYLVANVIRGLEIEKVTAIRELGLGYGQIAQAFALSEYSGLSVEEIAAHFTSEDIGFGDVAKLIGYHPAEINKDKKSDRAEQEDVVEDQAEIKEDQVEIKEDQVEIKEDQAEIFDNLDAKEKIQVEKIKVEEEKIKAQDKKIENQEKKVNNDKDKLDLGSKNNVKDNRKVVEKDDYSNDVEENDENVE